MGEEIIGLLIFTGVAVGLTSALLYLPKIGEREWRVFYRNLEERQRREILGPEYRQREYK